MRAIVADEEAADLRREAGLRARRGREEYENEQLRRYARPHPVLADMWIFAPTDRPRDREETLGLIRMFTGLGLTPSGNCPGVLLVALYDRLVSLEDQVRSSRLNH